MIQVVCIVALFAIIASGSCGTLDNSFHLQRLLNAKEKSKDGRELCRTRECEELAEMFVKSMNRSMDPCEDFYEYACGNWAKHNPPPEGLTQWNLYEKAHKTVDLRLQELIDEAPKPDDFYSTKVARQAFKACVDTDKMNKEGLEPLIRTMWRAGGWPLIMEEDEWDSNMYTWQKIDDYYAYLKGLNSFHDLTVHVDHYTDEIELTLSTPHLPYHMYLLVTEDEIKTDSSDENNDSGEGSQEAGSEEREDYEGSGEDYEDGSGSGDEDDEDEYQLQRRRKISNRITHSKPRMSNKIKVTKMQFNGGKLENRVKRNIMETKKHMEKQNKRRRIPNGKIDHIMKKVVKESSKHKSVLGSHNKRAKVSSSKNNKQGETRVNDLYFYDAKAKDNESENKNEDEEENDESSNKDSSDVDRDNENNDSEDDDEDNEEDYDSDYEDNDANESVDSNEEREKRIKKAEERRKRYAEFMLNVSLALSKARGVSISEEKLKEDIDDLVEFQVNLVKCMRSSGKRKNITIESFQKEYDSFEPQTHDGSINWVRKIQDAFANGGMDLDPDENIEILVYTYFKKLRLLLDTTPSRTIVNYVHWNFIAKVIKATTKEMRKFYLTWIGIKTGELFWAINCIYEMKIEYILEYKYVKRYFPDEVSKEASDMLDEIQKEIEYDIKKSPWMDDKVRHIILDKLVYMEKVLGYVDVYKNDTIMKEDLKGLSVGNSHFENILTMARYFKAQNLKMILTKGFDTRESLSKKNMMSPLTTNAFFIPFKNIIDIAAAMFQAPYYSQEQPWYMNYGMIGRIMGHEVNHAFDTYGRRSDRKGARIHWSRKMAKEYKKRAQCIIDQFTNYSVVENKTGNLQLKNYGRQTLGENIADIMGLQASFKAYQRRMRECERPDPMLPGLEDLSNEQLFFLSFGYSRCEVYADTETFEKSVKMDSHSPSLLRVIGSVSNSEDFAKAYNCPLGSPMNPKKKCNIWK